MKLLAMEMNQDVARQYIKQISLGQNFVAIWSAQATLNDPLLREAADKKASRDACADIFHDMSQQAGRINQFGANLLATLDAYYTQSVPANKQFQDVIDKAITQLGTEAQDAQAEIDRLNEAIAQNISDIVTGANEAGSGVTELLTGVLTTIANAKADETGGKTGGKAGDKAGEAEKKLKKPTAKAADKGGDKKTAGKDAGKDGGKPSNAFVVDAIKASSEGVAKTAQARADLATNNTLLAAAYQKLAEVDALTAVAKVVSIQASQMVAAMGAFETSVKALTTTWGRSPITPPGGGRSQAMDDFANEIAGLTASAEAVKLADQVAFVTTDWDLLGRRLRFEKTAITSGA